jgi:type III secretion system PrgH/EprH family protein
MSLSSEMESPSGWAILRLLSGPLRGCEYRLTDSTTLVVTENVDALVGRGGGVGVPEFPGNSIVIPMMGGCNFEIFRDENLTDGFHLFVLEDVVEERVCHYLDECRVGLLSFSVRPDGMAWSSSFDPDQSLSQAKKSDARSRMMWSRMMPAVLGSLVLFFFVGASFFLLKKFGEDRHVAEVSALIDGSVEPYRLAHGRDGLVYVFAENERDASWARQVLTREKMNKYTRVSTVKEEEARLDRLLFEKYPSLAFYRLRLTDPVNPTILLSKERSQLGDKEGQEVVASLITWMPYAEKIVKALWSDSLLDDRAKGGLDRMHLAYDRSDSVGSVTYRIQGDLSDSDESHRIWWRL